MAQKFGFTMASIEKLTSPESGRRWVYDQKIPGLALLVTPTGAKSFYWLKKISGQTERFRLGGFPEITVDAARDLAMQHNIDAASGVNPANSRRKHKKELTLSELWDLYLEFHGPKKKASSLVEDKRLWKRYLTSWSGRKLSSIANPDVQRWHSKLGKDNGKYAANRALALLSIMYSVAKDHGEWKQLNPAEGVKKFSEKSRDRFLQPDELERFLKAVDAEPDQKIADVFRLCLWTGQRKGNVLSMKWEDVDLSASVWRIPDTKGNEPLRVPLVPEAVMVLKRLEDESKKTPNKSQYVFPSKEAGTLAGHVQNVQHQWKSVITVANLPNLRIHDLRRTLGSWQALQGSPLQVIGKSLGHKHAATTEIYARLMLDPVRESMEKATSAMSAAGKSETGAEK